MSLFFMLFSVDVEEEGEESKWQDRISSGFDRLVAFASTELDKRRRSTEGGDSCNTSPDSGIGHTEPCPITQNVALIKKNESHKINKPSLKSSMFKTPKLKRHLDSPPPQLDQYIEEGGPPRTPSPSPSPKNNQTNVYQNDKIKLNPALCKYQRQEAEKKTQSRPDQHYKKKFYYREWRESGNDRAWEHEPDDHTAHTVNDNSKKFNQHKPNKNWDLGYKDINSSFVVNKMQNDNQWPRNDVYNVGNEWKN